MMKRFVLLQDLLMIDDCPGFALLLIFQGNRPRGEIKAEQEVAEEGSITPAGSRFLANAFYSGTLHLAPRTIALLTRDFAMCRSRGDER